jgi:ribonuclease HI
MTEGVYLIWADGGARGNPGPAAYGFVIEGPGISRVLHGKAIGKATNNIAEYLSVIEALKKLKSLLGSAKATNAAVRVHADSELLVRQANREYKVKDTELQEKFMQLHNLRLDFASVAFVHVPRAKNADADRLVNEALDNEQGSLKL